MSRTPRMGDARVGRQVPRRSEHQTTRGRTGPLRSRSRMRRSRRGHRSSPRRCRSDASGSVEGASRHPAPLLRRSAGWPVPHPPRPPEVRRRSPAGPRSFSEGDVAGQRSRRCRAIGRRRNVACKWMFSRGLRLEGRSRQPWGVLAGVPSRNGFLPLRRKVVSLPKSDFASLDMEPLDPAVEEQPGTAQPLWSSRSRVGERSRWSAVRLLRHRPAVRGSRRLRRSAVLVAGGRRLGRLRRPSAIPNDGRWRLEIGRFASPDADCRLPSVLRRTHGSGASTPCRRGVDLGRHPDENPSRSTGEVGILVDDRRGLQGTCRRRSSGALATDREISGGSSKTDRAGVFGDEP